VDSKTGRCCGIDKDVHDVESIGALIVGLCIMAGIDGCVGSDVKKNDGRRLRSRRTMRWEDSSAAGWDADCSASDMLICRDLRQVMNLWMLSGSSLAPPASISCIGGITACIQSTDHYTGNRSA
jgi:hypothetical protein